LQPTNLEDVSATADSLSHLSNSYTSLFHHFPPNGILYALTWLTETLEYPERYKLARAAADDAKVGFICMSLQLDRSTVIQVVGRHYQTLYACAHSWKRTYHSFRPCFLQAMNGASDKASERVTGGVYVLVVLATSCRLYCSRYP
jgi:hypothetical protein